MLDEAEDTLSILRKSAEQIDSSTVDGKKLDMFLSELYAEMLAFYYNGMVSYHHLNKNYRWEFRIINYLGETIYESKGLRKDKK